MIKVTPIDFLYYFKKNVSNSKFISLFMKLSTASHLISFMIKHYDKKSINESIVCIKNFILANNIDFKQFKELLKDFKPQSKQSLSIDTNTLYCQNIIPFNDQFLNPYLNSNIILYSANINTNINNYPFYYQSIPFPYTYCPNK